MTFWVIFYNAMFLLNMKNLYYKSKDFTYITVYTHKVVSKLKQKWNRIKRFYQKENTNNKLI